MRNCCKSEDKGFRWNTCNCGNNNWKNNKDNSKEECHEFKCCCCPVEKKEKEPEHTCKFCCEFEKKEENKNWGSNNFGCNVCQNNHGQYGWENQGNSQY